MDYEKSVTYTYPEFNCRENYLAGVYCEMALEFLYDVYELYDAIKKENYAGYMVEEKREMDKKVISLIVFSAMTIESFFNNYAASCMGDDEFYENFDRLSTISKFQLIAKFMLKINIDKSKAYYSYLKELIKNRDVFVHNKSKEFTFRTYSESEYEKIIEEEKELEKAGCFDDLSNIKDETEKDIRIAINALRAVKEIAEVFDKCDNNINALQFLFHPSGVLYGNEKEKRCKEKIFPILRIKVGEQ